MVPEFRGWFRKFGFGSGILGFVLNCDLGVASGISGLVGGFRDSFRDLGAGSGNSGLVPGFWDCLRDFGILSEISGFLQIPDFGTNLVIVDLNS